jgi:hypothetical protein
MRTDAFVQCCYLPGWKPCADTAASILAHAPTQNYMYNVEQSKQNATHNETDRQDNVSTKWRHCWLFHALTTEACLEMQLKWSSCNVVLPLVVARDLVRPVVVQELEHNVVEPGLTRKAPSGDAVLLAMIAHFRVPG